jgi:hypothetical protein
MTQTLYVDPAHRIPDEDWAAVVRRAEEIAREAAENRTGGAAPVAGPVIDMRGRSNKHSGVSGIPTQLLVLHSAECPLMPGYAQSLTEWAITSTVVASWHRFIGPDSRVRMIDDALAAWHASEANPMSIGWEQAGYARYTRADWVTPNGMLQMESLAYDMAQVALAEGIPAVWLTTDQVTAVTTYGNRSIKGFCLHRQIDPETRTDPGDGYPYELLMAKIRSYMGLTSESTTSEEDELSADMPMISKDNAKVTLQTVLNSIDEKTEAVFNAVDSFPLFDAQVREQFDIQRALERDLRADLAQKGAQIDGLTAAVTALAGQQSGVTTEEVLAAIESAAAKFAAGYKLTLQPVEQEAGQ